MVKNQEFNELKDEVERLKGDLAIYEKQLRMMDANVPRMMSDLHAMIQHNAYVIGVFAQALESLGAAEIDPKTYEFTITSREDLQQIAEMTFRKAEREEKHKTKQKELMAK